MSPYYLNTIHLCGIISREWLLNVATDSAVLRSLSLSTLSTNYFLVNMFLLLSCRDALSGCINGLSSDVCVYENILSSVMRIMLWSVLYLIVLNSSEYSMGITYVRFATCPRRTAQDMSLSTLPWKSTRNHTWDPTRDIQCVVIVARSRCDKTSLSDNDYLSVSELVVLDTLVLFSRYDLVEQLRRQTPELNRMSCHSWLIYFWSLFRIKKSCRLDRNGKSFKKTMEWKGPTKLLNFWDLFLVEHDVQRIELSTFRYADSLRKKSSILKNKITLKYEGRISWIMDLNTGF